jgi:hypothetical protein
MKWFTNSICFGCKLRAGAFSLGSVAADLVAAVTAGKQRQRQHSGWRKGEKVFKKTLILSFFTKKIAN